MDRENNDMKQQKDSYDRCIVCGEYTDMQKDWSLEMRKHYVEGAGQLCGKCYRELYN